jgi:ribonuclease P protein component
LKRSFRLRSKTDFERVRRTGKSYAHPLIVLIASPNELEQTRIGVSAGRSVGGAVQRNRAKRRIRGALAPLLGGLLPGTDLILLARKGIIEADFNQLQEAIIRLLRKAGAIQAP